MMSSRYEVAERSKSKKLGITDVGGFWKDYFVYKGHDFPQPKASISFVFSSQQVSLHFKHTNSSLSIKIFKRFVNSEMYANWELCISAQL